MGAWFNRGSNSEEAPLTLTLSPAKPEERGQETTSEPPTHRVLNELQLRFETLLITSLCAPQTTNTMCRLVRGRVLWGVRSTNRCGVCSDNSARKVLRR